jgi:uncharacterized protein (UPF0332 family)
LPTITVVEGMLRHVATLKASAIVALSGTGSRNPFPVADVVRQVTSDRLGMAGSHLRAADQLLQNGIFRASISRHYYAMYHTARAVVFAEAQGDDHQQHGVLARKLPSNLPKKALREAQLTDARLLRNEADYDPYPMSEALWADDAQALGATASEFISELEEFALTTGLI